MSMILVTCPICPVCDKADEIELDESAVRRWQRGAYVQDAFPDMSADQREVLITGTHPKCWDELMGPEE